VIVKIAQNHGIEVSKVILSYLLGKGYVVLPRSSKENHIASNIQIEGITLTNEEVSQIDKLSRENSVKVCWDSKDVV
jgi:diketogulonate reductase-like aldo/keto reductase